VKKVTPEVMEKMIEMRANGYPYWRIALELGLAETTVRYWLNPKYRERVIRNVSRWERGKLRSDGKYRERKREYLREYIRTRYNEDPEFRMKAIEAVLRYEEKRKNK